MAEKKYLRTCKECSAEFSAVAPQTQKCDNCCDPQKRKRQREQAQRNRALNKQLPNKKRDTINWLDVQRCKPEKMGALLKKYAYQAELSCGKE